MKTTLEIDPEVYGAAERLAQAQQKSPEEVVSELLRKALGMPPATGEPPVPATEHRNGFSVFPVRPGPEATVKGVRQLCHEEGI